MSGGGRSTSAAAPAGAALATSERARGRKQGLWALGRTEQAGSSECRQAQLAPSLQDSYSRHRDEWRVLADGWRGAEEGSSLGLISAGRVPLAASLSPALSLPISWPALSLLSDLAAAPANLSSPWPGVCGPWPRWRLSPGAHWRRHRRPACLRAVGQPSLKFPHQTCVFTRLPLQHAATQVCRPQGECPAGA